MVVVEDEKFDCDRFWEEELRVFSAPLSGRREDALRSWNLPVELAENMISGGGRWALHPTGLADRKFQFQEAALAKSALARYTPQDFIALGWKTRLLITRNAGASFFAITPRAHSRNAGKECREPRKRFL